MRVLFVCTGNTCRSVMAEYLARRIASERNLTVSVDSAGTAAWNGAPASDGALLVCLEHDVDLSPHRARLLTHALLESYELVLAMGPHHLERVAIAVPQVVPRVALATPARPTRVPARRGLRVRDAPL